jgi:hypothetical protein
MNTICRVNSLAIHPNANTAVTATDNYLTQLFTSKRSISNIISNKNNSNYSNKNNKNTKSVNNNPNRSLKTAAYKKNFILVSSNNSFSNFVKSSLPINRILGNLQLNKCDKF